MINHLFHQILKINFHKLLENCKRNTFPNFFVPFQKFAKHFTQTPIPRDHYLKWRNEAHGLMQLKLERKTFTNM